MLKKIVTLVVFIALILGSVPAVVYSQSLDETSKAGETLQIKIPQLTLEEENILKQTIFFDKEVVDILGDNQYDIVKTGVWVEGKEREKVGGFIQLALSKPIVMEREWPIVEYNNGEREYSDSELAIFAQGKYLKYRKYEKVEVAQMCIQVDLRLGKVVGITPLSFGPLPGEDQNNLTLDAGLINYTPIPIGVNDLSYNWDCDHEHDPVPINELDMPVTLIFCGNINDQQFIINKVKDMYWGANGGGHWEQYLMSYDNDLEWDDDHGTTGEIAPGSPRYHLRLYAHNPPDYNSDPLLGRYVIGASHIDLTGSVGWSENAAYYFVNHAVSNHNCTVRALQYNFQNMIGWGNPMGYLWDGHMHQCDGIVLIIDVP